MPDSRRRTCLSCGKPDTEVGSISWRGNCSPCGLARETQAIVELAEHRGPMYRRWRTKLIEALTDPPLLDSVATTSDSGR